MTTREEITNYLGRCEQPKTARQIATVIGRPPASVRRVLNYWIHDFQAGFSGTNVTVWRLSYSAKLRRASKGED